MQLYAMLLQLPGVEAPTLTWQEWVRQEWIDTGWMAYPLAFCLILGLIVIVVKFITLTAKAARTKKILREVDELLTQQRIREALELTRETDPPRRSSTRASSGTEKARSVSRRRSRTRA